MGVPGTVNAGKQQCIDRRQGTRMGAECRQRNGACRQFVVLEQPGENLRVVDAPVDVQHMEQAGGIGSLPSRLVVDQIPFGAFALPVSQLIEHPIGHAAKGLRDQQVGVAARSKRRVRIEVVGQCRPFEDQCGGASGRQCVEYSDHFRAMGQLKDRLSAPRIPASLAQFRR